MKYLIFFFSKSNIFKTKKDKVLIFSTWLDYNAYLPWGKFESLAATTYSFTEIRIFKLLLKFGKFWQVRGPLQLQYLKN